MAQSNRASRQEKKLISCTRFVQNVSMMGEKHLDVIRQCPLSIRVKSVWRDFHRCTSRALIVNSLVQSLVDQNAAIWPEVPDLPS